MPTWCAWAIAASKGCCPYCSYRAYSRRDLLAQPLPAPAGQLADVAYVALPPNPSNASRSSIVCARGFLANSGAKCSGVITR